ncbi:uncharacterized protein LOC111605097 isoform X3 [Drosophila hydei]|uniref:E3 ubiquitin-protein ligase n=1 Tax=Drosophila hydei TaxID=7224 RepID=A0A6J1MQC0_DROHY|nr:uncharacterized protein LOC111605097 isoform X3 [Drosophila hydei]
MSKRLAASTDEGASNNTEQNATNANNNIINLDDSDDEDDDMQFVGLVHPEMPTIDLCVSPSTSAAAAAAAASSATAAVAATSASAASEALKTANIETDVAVVTSNATSGADAPGPTATLECPICLQTCIHPARLPCGHIFCFLCVKGVAYKNRRCAMCRREIPAEFLDHPQLVNGIDDICATRATEDGYQWYYEGRNGGWWAYDVRTNEELEMSYQAYHSYKVNRVAPTVKEGKPVSRNGGANVDYKLNEMFDNVDYGDCEESSTDSSSDFEMQYGSSPDEPSRFQQLICGQLYIIDLIGMTQTLRSQSTRKRNIIRRKRSEPAPGVKGVAGLKHHFT